MNKLQHKSVRSKQLLMEKYKLTEDKMSTATIIPLPTKKLKVGKAVEKFNFQSALKKQSLRSQANTFHCVLSPKDNCWKHCVFVLSRIQKSDKKHLFHKSSKRDKRLLFKSDYLKSLKEHEES